MTARKLFKGTVAVVLGACLSGCYYVHAARGQLEILSKRDPIDEVIAADDTPRELAARLALVQEARRFAVDELRLPDNGSYLSYADLERDYVVWSLMAAPEFSLQPKDWCYPIVGCLSYRGYFSRARAERAGGALRQAGYDVYVFGVPAYSTLGRLDDPLLNTMLRFPDAELVAMIFHELAHQVLYLKDNTMFNESFATAVEQIGIERWLGSRAAGDELDHYRARRAHADSTADIITRAREDLEALYASSLAPHEMRAGKRRRFAQLDADLAAERERAGLPAAEGSAGDLNNAYLIPTRLYRGRVSDFHALYALCNEDLGCFYERAAELAD